MATNTSAFSPKEWRIGIAEEVTVGTAPSSFLGIEFDSMSYPTINDLRILEKRSGSTGRVLNEDDLFYHEAGSVHEFSVSGILTTALVGVLFENAVGVEQAANGSASYDVVVGTGHAPVSFLHGATSSGGHNTVAFQINGTSSPNSSYTLKGCIVTALTISANSDEEGGRFKFELTAQTRSPFTSSAGSQGTISAYTENFLYLSDFTEDKTVYAQSVILDTFGLTVENPVKFLGNKASGGNAGLPEGYQRAIPEFKALANCSVKFDANTNDFINSWRSQSVATPKGLYLANNATWASATTFGIKMDNVIFSEQPSYDEGDYMKLSCVLQSVDDESDSDILSVIVGDQ
tara:strand:- start:132 stop:1172 length:1041 start_codon:yes stop_codon:yes gene_type:complete